MRLGRVIVRDEYHVDGRQQVARGDSSIVVMRFVVRGLVSVADDIAEDAVRDREVFGPGDIFVTTDTEAYVLEATEGAHSVQLVLPRDGLERRGVRFANRSTESTNARLARPLRLIIADALDAAHPLDAVDAGAIERAIKDLVATMLLSADATRDDGAELRARLRDRARRSIDLGYNDPSLSAQVVARQLSVSWRHLQRAFEGQELSLHAEIGRRRAEAAAVLLAHRTDSDLSMSEVALRCGFSSTQAFRLTFTRHYGVQPSRFVPVAARA